MKASRLFELLTEYSTPESEVRLCARCDDDNLREFDILSVYAGEKHPETGVLMVWIDITEERS